LYNFLKKTWNGKAMTTSNIKFNNYAERAQLATQIQEECDRAEKGEKIDLIQTAAKLQTLIVASNKDIATGKSMTPREERAQQAHQKDLTALTARVNALSSKASGIPTWVKPTLAALAITGLALIVMTLNKVGNPSSPTDPQQPPLNPQEPPAAPTENLSPEMPTFQPTVVPTLETPTFQPTVVPTLETPTFQPTVVPTLETPTFQPTVNPTIKTPAKPTEEPREAPVPFLEPSSETPDQINGDQESNITIEDLKMINPIKQDCISWYTTTPSDSPLKPSDGSCVNSFLPYEPTGIEAFSLTLQNLWNSISNVNLKKGDTQRWHRMYSNPNPKWINERVTRLLASKHYNTAVKEFENFLAWDLKPSDYKQVYDQLIAAQQDLTKDSLCVLHKQLAEGQMDYSFIAAHACDCYETDDPSLAALRNARAYASLEKADLAGKWLLVASKDDRRGAQAQLQAEKFTDLKNKYPEFQEYVDRLQDKK
jgi:hypothetical protein